ncbi:hypothetical protein PR202_gb25906 [Eleusine coracana subsp. coracana]|uniref:Retrotransposon gag domain-containing protein n=1 Tax=Eleusine coracana subsp. coracana TaxID=191504 RepID=A0AAV5FQ71_ELECO|nr:hypothetical protein PR202_gb25906 [Eleusine coracana subsp. coracana]
MKLLCPLDCTEWNEFKPAFSAHFIPTGLMQRKFQEFMDLKQGGRNVLQYSKTTGTYNDLVNPAIVQEGAMRQVEEEDLKRKAPASASAAPQVKHRLIYTSPTG